MTPKTKYLILILALLQTLNSFSQEWKEEIVKIEKDTISSIINVIIGNDVLCEKRYLKTLESQRNATKEDLFMRGIKPLSNLDSIILFVYDKYWNISESRLIVNKDSIEKYSYYKYSDE